MENEAKFWLAWNALTYSEAMAVAVLIRDQWDCSGGHMSDAADHASNMQAASEAYLEGEVSDD